MNEPNDPLPYRVSNNSSTTRFIICSPTLKIFLVRYPLLLEVPYRFIYIFSYLFVELRPGNMEINERLELLFSRVHRVSCVCKKLLYCLDKIRSMHYERHIRRELLNYFHVFRTYKSNKIDFTRKDTNVIKLPGKTLLISCHVFHNLFSKSLKV